MADLGLIIFLAKPEISEIDGDQLNLLHAFQLANILLSCQLLHEKFNTTLVSVH